MLGSQQLRLYTIPGRDDEHVIPGLPVFCRAWLVQDSKFLERTRLDSDLLPEFANEGVGRSLVALAVPTDDVPHTGIELSILRAPGQTDLASPNEKATRADPHGPHRRPGSRRDLYI